MSDLWAFVESRGSQEEGNEKNHSSDSTYVKLLAENVGLGEFPSDKGMVESTRHQQAKSSDQEQVATDFADDLTEMLLVSSFSDASNEEAEA